MCAPRATRHTSIRYSSSCHTHTRVYMGASIFFTAAIIRVNYDEKQFIGKKCLSRSFYMYRSRKYVSYGFPITNFSNPRVHYESPVYSKQRINSPPLKPIKHSCVKDKQIFCELWLPKECIFSDIWVVLRLREGEVDRTYAAGNTSLSLNVFYPNCTHTHTRYLRLFAEA
jgi:hypothetical protein